MTSLRSALILSLLLVSMTSVMAKPCNTREIIASILGVKDSTGEWLRKHFQYKSVREFDSELYFKNKAEFDNLKTVGQLPDAPPKSESERHLAWLDTQTETGEMLPSVLDVLDKGTETQKARLHKWVKKYSEKKLTDHQIHEAAVDLSLILHNTKFNLPELIRNGAGKMAEKMVKSQYHQHFIHEQLKLALVESEFLKKENLLNVLMRWKETTPGKWIYTAGANAYAFSMAKDYGHLLLIALPEHQIAKLTAEDLAILMKTGGVNSPKFEEIASRYQGVVKKQVLYNTIHSIIEYAEKFVWLEFGLHKWHQYHERKAKLDAKDHS